MCIRKAHKTYNQWCYGVWASGSRTLVSIFVYVWPFLVIRSMVVDITLCFAKLQHEIRTTSIWRATLLQINDSGGAQSLIVWSLCVSLDFMFRIAVCSKAKLVKLVRTMKLVQISGVRSLRFDWLNGWLAHRYPYIRDVWSTSPSRYPWKFP